MKIILRWVDNNWRGLTLFLWLAITVMSLMPLPELPIVPGTDKAHHIVTYGALMFPIALHKHRRWMWFAIAFIIWSGLIELIQPYVNRYAEWLDLVANTIGVGTGILLAMTANYIGLGRR